MLDTIERAKFYSTDAAISKIVNEFSPNVVVPHMFDYPGMTAYRSLFEVLKIPYIGSPAVM